MKDNKDKILLIYHCEDNDGVFSSAIIYDYLINKLNIYPTDVILKGLTYNGISEIEKSKELIKELMSYSKLIMTDISFHDMNLMSALYVKYKDQFIWIDHHAPIINETNKVGLHVIQGIRDTSRSAIMNAYKYLYDPYDGDFIDGNVPSLYKILSAYDSFNFTDYSKEYSANVNTGINLIYGLDFNNIYKLVKSIRIESENKNSSPFAIMQKLDNITIKNANERGIVANEYMNYINKNMIDQFGDFEWNVDDNGTYHKAVCIVSQIPTSTLTFKSVDSSEYENGIVFKRFSNGNWGVSLYNINPENNDFHCGNFCKEKYNGGGHAGASGFVVSNDEAMKMLSNKII